jgi:YVTN family beta-propeller protein
MASKTILKIVLALVVSWFATAGRADSSETGALVDGAGEIREGVWQTPINQIITPAGRQVQLPALRPQVLVLSPDRRVLVTSGQTSELILVSPQTGEVLQRVALPANPGTNFPAGSAPAPMLQRDAKAEVSFTGLVFSPDGSRLYLSNVNGDIKVFIMQGGKAMGIGAFLLPPANAPRRKEEIPSGLAISPDGKRLYVVLNLSNRLAELDASNGRVLRLWDVGTAPYDVVLAGHKAYVSNWGGRRPDPTSLTGPAGRGTVVRVDPVHYIASEGSLSVVDLNAEGKTTEIPTGLHTSGLALSPNGRYVAACNSGSDTITVVDTRNDTVVETIWARQAPNDLFGAQPNAIAFDGAGNELFVCNGTQNAVGVIQFKPGNSKLVGLIPVGWFPGAVVFDPQRNQICVANIKGFRAGRIRKSDGRREFNSLELQGSLSLVPLPSNSQLARFTGIARANMKYPLLAQSVLPPRAGRPPCPVPERAGEPSVFKHVIYIIKENRTYDQVLGDMPEGNGDSSLCVFGQHVTPNQHKLARDFVLLDNTYCSGIRSSDGHQWTDSAIATEYLERSFAGFPRSYPAGGDITSEDALAYSPAGFIWDDAIAHGKTLRDYGEFSQDHTAWKEPGRKGTPGFLDIYTAFTNRADTIALWSEPVIGSLRPYLATNTAGWDLSVPDVLRASRFIEDLHRFERQGQLPDLQIIWLPNDHTAGTSPGAPTPAAQMADNDRALGWIVEAVSHSRFWSDTCIFAIEDDPQSGWDHVSAFRTTAYVASPYTRRHQVILTQYNTTSLLRTIELILGLPPMNQMDATATPMFDCFMPQPNLAAFDAVPNEIPLDQMNPPAKKIADSILRKDAYASARLPLARPDQCPDDKLNQILWHAMAGSRRPYPRYAAGADDE